MRYYSERGSGVQPVFSPKVEPDGRVILVKTGEENVYDFIQSYKESTDMSVIVQRVLNGEPELLQQREGFYGDFTSMPKTYAEILQLQIDAGRLFDSLPVEIKQKFDSDPNVFMASAGSETWYKNLEKVLPDDVKAKVFPEVKEDVVESVVTVNEQEY